jgi:hypothetical protein
VANTYADPNFDIKSADIDVAGLETLKGGAVASTDIIYVSEGCRVTVNADMSCLKFYLGDNLAGTAAVKTGHLSVVTGGAGDVNLTLFDTAANGGLTGEGTTSTITLTGASDSERAGIIGNTASKVSNNAIPQCLITSLWGEFNNLLSVVIRNTGNSFINTNFINIDNALYAGSIGLKPAAISGCTFTGCTYALRDSTTTTPIDWGNFFTTNELYMITDLAKANNILIPFGQGSGISRRMYARFDANSMIAVPAWTTTTGIQTLTANSNGTLTASWNGATHATGDQVRYRIYIRAGSAPDAFGTASAYYLCGAADTTFVIGGDATGTALAAGTTYYVVVRAATSLSAEDTNTTSLNATVLAATTGKKHLRGSRLS